MDIVYSRGAAKQNFVAYGRWAKGDAPPLLRRYNPLFSGRRFRLSGLRLAVLVLISVLATLPSWAQEGCGDESPQLTHYRLHTLSGHRNPIHVDGYLTFQDDPAANQRIYWVHASVKNVSKKRISYWSVRLETKVQTGPGLDLRNSHDYFFTGGALVPSGSEDVQSCPIRLVLRSSKGKSFSEVRQITVPVSATARVELVQYSEGSTWGNGVAEAELHQSRRDTLNQINMLQQVYSKQGEQAFLQALKEPTWDQCFEQIKENCRSQSTNSGCVREAIQHMLATAAQQRELEPR